MSTKVSILMANYNAGRFIGQAIESVINQTYKNWELIIVDDKSQDNSIDIIDKYLSDDRIKLFIKTINGGYGKSLRITVQHATGQLYAIVDSDDMIRKDAIEIMVNAHKNNPHCGLIYSQFMKCDEKMRKTMKGDCGPIPEGYTWLDRMLGKLPKSCPRVSHLKVFTRKAFNKTEGFHDLRRTVDKDIVLKLEEVTNLLYIDEVLYYYRAHPAGISRSTKTRPYGQEIIDSAKKRRGIA